MTTRTWLAAGLVLTLTAAAPAQPKNDAWKALAKNIPLFDRDSVDALAGSLRGHLVRNLPPVLYEAAPGWGEQKLVPNGIEWKGQGFKVRPKVQETHKNHGTWTAVRIATAGNLADSLVFDLRNVQNPEPGRLTFDVFLSFDGRIDCNQQVWRSGVRVHSGSYRARFRAKLLLRCEVTARLEPGKQWLPDAVVRLRATGAHLAYDNVAVEHAAGVGGELANLLGEAVKGGLRQWHPSLERALLAKADAAIVQAADTKDVRVSLGKLLSGKK
jgi:hypothetical protein